MAVAMIILYALIGLVVGSIGAWEAAKEESRRRDPQAIAPLAVGLSAAICWPVVLLFVAIGSAGAKLIELAGRSDEHG